MSPSIEALKSAFSLIPNARRRKLLFISTIQSFLAIFDLIGIALIGIIGALSISGVKSTTPNSSINEFLTILGLGNISIQEQVAILGICAAFFLVSKTLISAYISRKILVFLSRNTAFVASSMYGKLLNKPALMLDGTSSQQMLYSITQGVQSLNIGAIGALTSIFSEFMLLIILLVGLFFYDWVLAIGTLVWFGSVAICLYFIFQKRARDLGKNYSRLLIETSDIFVESRKAYREIFVRNQIHDYWKHFENKRNELSVNVAKSAFIPQFSKYALEIALITGALLVTALQFSRGNAEEAVASLSVFLATSSRLAPSTLRLQQSFITLKISIAEASVTHELIKVLDSSSRGDSEITGDDVNSLKSLIDPFDGSVKLESVMVTYPTAETPSLIDINLSIPKGTFTAIVGPSGAGKSTLADCILGIVKPSEGKVWVSGVAPSKAIKLWPGKIGYVPQEIYLSRKSVADNILFEITANKNSENRDLKLKEALTVAGALSFVSSLPLGAETEIGEEGSQLSGGQRQRLGIARALYPNPELLVLDEATSALDALSENALTEELLGMRGSRTLIVIAHRLSTVQSADSIVYLQNGRIKGMGTFGELYDQNKDFADQVDAMKMREER